MTLTPRQVADLLEHHDLEPNKALGQNFLVDPNTVRRIVSLARVTEGQDIVEVGPGLGSLTLALCDAGATVLAVEADRHLIEPLSEIVGGLPVEILHGDALELGWAARLDSPVWLVANLPYNVATPLVAEVLDRVPLVEKLVVMVQAEVGERLIAGVGDSAYGAVSVKVASWASGRRLCKVPPTVFIPRPKVDSVVVELVRHREPVVPEDIDRESLMSLVRAGFGQRRKMLRRSLKGLVTAEQFTRAEIRPEARAEELDLQDWVRLEIARRGLLSTPQRAR
ncbi:MAG: 16S rRNA (adenine(1518)-N(6)/adenine(1519)-N(6))-dimethyltransferase RsmA [Actinomycetia bacterium]|nr:16S rRNA (adenine(1518)-N(6)/adenine(1519)-N(6))-dimethyltransferase RsmA [Actinomycetes bacterium]MCP4961219.1 16S rRNA (adenine(1518)-N(6)/adenine(1519)-N(6))-dimethyltransferase RsmA [Actinomycetes bacterium]